MWANRGIWGKNHDDFGIFVGRERVVKRGGICKNDMMMT